MEAATHYADSDGTSIAYQVHGEGPARFLRRLTSFARLIVYDKRGQGLSDRPGRPPTLEESMDDLRAVMDAAGSERAAILGISEGGPVSALFAASYPERVAALVLYGTWARMLKADDHPSGIDARSLGGLREMFRAGWGGAVGAEIWAPSAAEEPDFRTWWARLLRQARARPARWTSSTSTAKSTSAPFSPPSRPRPSSSTGATTSSSGRPRAAISPTRPPDARFVALDGADHLAWIGDQDTLLDEVEEFLVGSRRAHEPDRALATVLFTDIVDSTATAARLGDRAYRDLIQRHDTIVRRHLTAHRGREVKAMGDGFLATFDGPARAIRCATAIRDSVSPLPHPRRHPQRRDRANRRRHLRNGRKHRRPHRRLSRPGEVCVPITVKDFESPNAACIP